MSKIEAFLKEHRIDEVECLVPDMAGIARGKIVPAERFLKAMESHGLRIPEQIFVQTVTGHYPEEDTVCDPASKDVYLSPDPDTIRIDLLRQWMSDGGSLWRDMSKAMLSMPPNTLAIPDPQRSSQFSGLKGQAYGMGNFYCAPDEAVLLEFEAPACRHWSGPR